MIFKHCNQKNIFAYFFIVGILILVPIQTKSAEKVNSVFQFRDKLKKILASSCNKTSKIGIKFYSLDQKETLFEINSNRKLIPASNLKIITSVAALKRVGPDYRFYTRLYTDGHIEGTTLRGNLYIKGFGDPSLVTEQMWILVNELKNYPIKKVIGNIIADNSYFLGQGPLPNWGSYKGADAYLAPIGALAFNFNTITVHIAPNKKLGKPPLVIVDPPSPYIQVTNTAVTSKRGYKSDLIVNRLPHKNYDELVVAGKIPKRVARKKYYLNVTDPQWYTLNVFKDFLKRAGVEIKGKIKRGSLPKLHKLLLEHESQPLAEILRGLNKFSNNFMAEQILRVLAAEYFGPPGTTKNGVRFLHEYLQSLGISSDQFEIVGGSGLSRKNRLTANQIVRVLEDAYNDLSIFPEFISALGVMGLDGSVEERMIGNKEAQKIRVKTGTLNGVSALSGYFQSKDGEKFAFSILLNDLKCSNGKAMKLEDQIMEEALQFERKIKKSPPKTNKP